MRTEWIDVAPGVTLALDHWEPATADDGGVPFLLVHGLASNARLWDGVAGSLAARGHPVATVDLRGHGRSSKVDDGYEVATVAGDLATLIGEAGMGRPIVAGQSWGGNVVLELAARHPASVRAIACVDGGWIELRDAFPDWRTCRKALAPPRLAGRPLSEIEGWLRTAHPDWPESGIRGTLANFDVRRDGTIAPWLTFERHLTVLRGLWEHHPSEHFTALEVPVLLAPADDGAPDRADGRRRAVEAAAATIPRVRVRWFAGDHDIHAQHPAELADVLHEMTTDGFAP